MSQQGPDVAKRNKKRKMKPARPLLEQLPAVPAEAPEQQHKHKKHHRQQPQQQPPEQAQEQQPDALNAGNSKFARALGSTDFHTREQGLQALSRWLTHKQLVSELDMLKLWKGIYFCFWHSDKEPVQEDLAERLAGLIPRMQPAMAVLYWSAMLSTLRSEWFVLDRHRLNKFLMLVRKFVGAVFTRLAAEDWPVPSIQSFTSNLPLVGSVMPLTQARSLGLSYHLADVWLPELRKAAGEGSLRQEALQALLEPFVGVLQQSGEAALINRVRESVLEALVQDLSAAAAAAAAGAGGAGSSSDEDDEESDSTAWAYCQHLDVTAYASLLFDSGAQEGVRSRNREALYSISKDLERLAGKRRKAAAAGGGGRGAAAAAGAAAAGSGAGKKQKQKVQQEQQGHQQDAQQQQQPESGRKAKKQKQAQQQQQQVEEPVANGHADQPSSSKKQRKHAQQQQQQVEPAGAAVTPDSSHALAKQRKQGTAGKKQGTPAAAAATAASAAAGAAAGSASALKRGVKIDLKKNLYFEHGAPPPAAEIRTPPRAKPKGSALKSAVQLDSSGRPAGASTAPAGTKQSGAQRRLVTPSSVPRLKASEFF